MSRKVKTVTTPNPGWQEIADQLNAELVMPEWFDWLPDEQKKLDGSNHWIALVESGRVSHVPRPEPGTSYVYLVTDSQLLDCYYAGMTCNPAARFREHALNARSDPFHWINQATYLFLFRFPGANRYIAQAKARLFEAQLIARFRPLKNVAQIPGKTAPIP